MDTPLHDMTVGEVIDLLSAYDRTAPFRLAMNPLFPMAHRPADVVAAPDENGTLVVFLAESADGEQIGFLPPSVAVQLTWQPPVDPPRRTRRRTA